MLHVAGAVARVEKFSGKAPVLIVALAAAMLIVGAVPFMNTSPNRDMLVPEGLSCIMIFALPSRNLNDPPVLMIMSPQSSPAATVALQRRI